MGGKAIKQYLGHEGKRLPAQEYYELTDILTPKLQNLAYLFKGEIDLVKSYKNKESFGDADYVGYVVDSRKYVRTILETFHSENVIWNSNVASFDINGFQIDITFVSKEDYVSSLQYQSQNDVGNLIGRIFHSRSLKYGHKGLFIVLRDNEDREIGEVLLSKDIKQIYDYADLEHKFEFDDLEDIYNFVIKSKYFHGDSFRPENLNQANRVRNAKRPTYTKFVEWLIQTGNIDKQGESYYYPRKLSAIEAIRHFGKEKEYVKLLAYKTQKETLAIKINGNIIKDLLNIEGEELGNFIQYLKRNEIWSAYLSYSHEHIKESLKNNYRIFSYAERNRT